MNIFTVISGVLLIIASLVIIVSVTMQETKGGLGGSFGADTSVFDRSKGKTNEARLQNATKVSGVALFVLALAVLAFNMIK